MKIDQLLKKVARSCLTENKMHIFFTEMSDNVARVVHDYRIRRKLPLQK